RPPEGLLRPPHLHRRGPLRTDAPGRQPSWRPATPPRPLLPPSRRCPPPRRPSAPRPDVPWHQGQTAACRLPELPARLPARRPPPWRSLQCLELLLDLVPNDGFILVNDYGQVQTSRDDEFEHQRFSLATFVGVNFPLLRAFCAQGNRCQYLEPSGDPERGIH